MSSVIRGKIWEGRCEFRTEEQRTSGKKEYVVNSQLRAFSTQLFDEGKYRNNFFHTCELFIFRYKSWFRHGLKKKFQEQKKKRDSCLASYNLERLCAKGWQTAINQMRRAQRGLARGSEALSLKYRQHCNYSCKVLFAELSAIFESIKENWVWFNSSLPRLTAWYS